MSEMSVVIDTDYVDLINDLKTQIKTAQIKAHRAVNTELIKLYWTIGKELLARQKVEAWGSKYLEQVSRDLQIEFPGMKGFSLRNLRAPLFILDVVNWRLKNTPHGKDHR